MKRHRALQLLLATALATSTLHRATAATPMVGNDPYVVGYLDGYRYQRYPVNAPYTPYRVPVYMYGYFSARPRHEPIRNQGFNDFINSLKRGYLW